MMSEQNAFEYVKDQMDQGKMTTDQANVAVVQMMSVRVISNRLPASVRKALNKAVKDGELGHIKKEGFKPEVYHHKHARPRALTIRDGIMREAMARLSKVYG